tara:strand:- start:360 stop:566 length:207 start_codon:yes stop_codon:yes gene_type:complete
MKDNLSDTDLWLINKGIDFKDLNIIKKIYKKEGILYHVRSFNENDLPDLKQFLKNKKKYCFYKLLKLK